MSEFSSLSVKELKKLMDQKGVSHAGCVEKRDLIDKLTRHMASLTVKPTGPITNEHVGVPLNIADDDEEVGPNGGVTKEAVGKILSNIPAAMTKLKNDYPPNKAFVNCIHAAATIEGPRYIAELTKNKLYPIAAHLMKKIYEDKGNVSIFLSLMATISNLASQPNEFYRETGATDALLKVISDVYSLIHSTNDTPTDSVRFPNVNERNRMIFQKLGVNLLANLTISDSMTPKVLRTPHLFEFGTSGIFDNDTLHPASHFMMNSSYEDAGKEKLLNSKIELFEALADFAASTKKKDSLENCHLTFSNVFVHKNRVAQNKILKALEERQFFVKVVARDIKLMYVNAVGLLLNATNEGLEAYRVINNDLMSALAGLVSKQCPQRIRELVSNVMRNFALHVSLLEKNIAERMATTGSQVYLLQMSVNPIDRSIAEFSSLILSKVKVVEGKIEIVEQKCCNVGCNVRSSKLKKCARCGGAWYCSKECQLSDWKAGHKEVCDRIKERIETLGKVDKKQGNVDRTVALDYLHEHEDEFLDLANEKGIKLAGSVVLVNFVTDVETKTHVFSIPEFYNFVAKEEPFKSTGGIEELNRMKSSHAKSEVPSFIAVVVQPNSIFYFVVPVDPSLDKPGFFYGLYNRFYNAIVDRFTYAPEEEDEGEYSDSDDEKK